MSYMGLGRKFMAAGLLAGCMMSMSVSLTGCMTDDKKDSTSTAPKHTAFGADTSLWLGAQGNTELGSAVDLDTKKVMLSDAALAAQGTIDLDLVFTDGSLKITSPVFAKNAGDVPLAAGYDLTKVKDTQFARITEKPADSEAAKAFYDSTLTDDNMLVFQGDQYLVKTDKGKLVRLEIAEVQGEGNTASVKLTIALSGI